MKPTENIKCNNKNYSSYSTEVRKKKTAHGISRKKNSNMVDLSSTVSITPLNVSALKTPSERQRLSC